jgi:hypothetical protein
MQVSGNFSDHLALRRNVSERQRPDRRVDSRAPAKVFRRLLIVIALDPAAIILIVSPVAIVNGIAVASVTVRVDPT